MAETTTLGLPLVTGNQAQKHVTVNEAFGRLDALSQITLQGAGIDTPPVAADDGEVYGIGTAPTGAWQGRAGDLAIWLNNGWVFVTPKVGWVAWLDDAGARAVFDGADWVAGAGAVSPNGAGFVHRTVEIDHTVTAGATSIVTGALPAMAIVYGVTGRVLTDIGGAGSISVGVAGSPDRYGSGIGTAADAWLRGITGQPLTYYGATDLVLTAAGGTFDGTGVLRLAVHSAELTLPRA